MGKFDRPDHSTNPQKIDVIDYVTNICPSAKLWKKTAGFGETSEICDNCVTICKSFLILVLAPRSDWWKLSYV